MYFAILLGNFAITNSMTLKNIKQKIADTPNTLEHNKSSIKPKTKISGPKNKNLYSFLKNTIEIIGVIYRIGTIFTINAFCTKIYTNTNNKNNKKCEKHCLKP
jgi:hypothetical protein